MKSLGTLLFQPLPAVPPANFIETLPPTTTRTVAHGTPPDNFPPAVIQPRPAPPVVVARSRTKR